MGLLGKKKDISDDEDSNRAALVSKKPNVSYPPMATTNPYAEALQDDPYTSAKEKDYRDAVDPCPAQHSQTSDQRHFGCNDCPETYNKSPALTRTMTGGGYDANRYGSQSGYSSDSPYGAVSRNQSQTGESRYDAGGYGGLGGDSFTPKQQDDDDRNALFGGRELMQQGQQQAPGTFARVPPLYGNSNLAEYGVQRGCYRPVDAGYSPGPKFDDRPLTAEEEEEEQINATKQQIRFTKQSDVATTRGALRTAQQAEEIGRDTLARLGVQGEHIHSTEKCLDLAHNQNKVAEEKARELKNLNRSMWAIHVNNPFTSGKKEEERNRAVVEKHVEEREQREATRRAAYISEQRMQQNFKGLVAPEEQKKREKNLAERAKYQFEADSDDERMENEIDDNLDKLEAVTGRLNALARATGTEVDAQNKHLERIAEKGDKVDVGIASNTARLDRIR